jgi:hypothetical protein
MLKYTPIEQTHDWTAKIKIDRDKPIDTSLGMRLYPIYCADTGKSFGAVPSNTTILDTPMDKITKMRWAKKLGDGDIGKGMEKSKWVSDYAKYTGTMMHRSLERIIKLAGNAEERYALMQQHALGRLLPAGADILGCELALLGDGFATTLDLVYEYEGKIVIAELKTLHRVSSDSEESMLDCTQERHLQSSKAGKYRKQMAAQAHALEYSYGVRADEARVYLFNTVTYIPEIALIMDRKMLDSRYIMFEKLKTKKMDEIAAMLDAPALDSSFGKNSPVPTHHETLLIDGVALSTATEYTVGVDFDLIEF